MSFNDDVASAVPGRKSIRHAAARQSLEASGRLVHKHRGVAGACSRMVTVGAGLESDEDRKPAGHATPPSPSFSVENSLQRRVAELEAALVAQADQLPPRELLISPDDTLAFRVGFLEREFDASGTPFRPMLPGEWAEIRFRLDRTMPATFELAFEAADAPLLGSYSAWVDYAPAPLMHGSAEEGPVTLHGVLPPMPGRHGAVITLIDGAGSRAGHGPRLRGVRIEPAAPATRQEQPPGAAADALPAVTRASARGPARARK